MQYASFFARTLRHVSLFLCVGLLLAACEVEGGVSRTENPTPTPVQVSASTTIAAVQAARDDTWSIGLLDEPKSLYPYPRDVNAQRIAAPLTELLFPSPILSLNYGYTTTGVLERIPTLENGDAQIRKADVFLDPTGIITTTRTEVITQVDQLVVTFRWNKKLRWSDGTPVTADDSVFAYELAKQSPPSDDARDRLGRTEAYEKVDDHTTRVILRADIIEPTYFLNYWTPLPRHLLQGVAPGEAPTGAFASTPVGYGPYAIEQRAPHEISMVRNQHYFGAPPATGRLVVTFMESLELLRGGISNGTLDVIVADRVPLDQFAPLDQDAGSKRARVIYQPNPTWTHIDFNLDIPVLQDIRLRRAIVHGTNRQAMVDRLFDGHAPVLESWVLPSQSEAAPLDQLSRYPYDPAQARKLLDEAGYITGTDGIRVSPDGVTLTFQLVTAENKGYPILQEAARMFSEDMRAIGIDIDVTPLPADQLFAPDGPLFQRQFEMALFAWIADADPGGLPLWSCNAVPSEQNGYSGDNFAGWCFRDANRAIRMAVTSLDPAERKAAYLLQQQKWTQEVPAVPLFQRLSVVLVGTQVQGPTPDALAPITWNVAAWRRMK
ncbi:MAG: peptide ABC transporter substrate-binding protein [Roseiflexaceae bacterium]